LLSGDSGDSGDSDAVLDALVSGDDTVVEAVVDGVDAVEDAVLDALALVSGDESVVETDVDGVEDADDVVDIVEDGVADVLSVSLVELALVLILFDVDSILLYTLILEYIYL
jgi:hypothetical protein